MSAAQDTQEYDVPRFALPVLTHIILSSSAQLGQTLFRCEHCQTRMYPLTDNPLQDEIDSRSEYGDGAQSALYSARSAADLNTLGDISPDAL